MNIPVSRLLEIKGYDIVQVRPTASVYDAIKIMAKAHVGAVLVIDERERLCGILSERDCFTKVILREKAPRRIQVRSIMSREVVTVPPGQTIDECLTLMSDRQIRHLPIVKDRRVLGLISMRDLVRYLATEERQVIRDLEKYIEGSV